MPEKEGELWREGVEETEGNQSDIVKGKGESDFKRRGRREGKSGESGMTIFSMILHVVS